MTMADVKKLIKENKLLTGLTQESMIMCYFESKGISHMESIKILLENEKSDIINCFRTIHTDENVTVYGLDVEKFEMLIN